MYIFSRRAIQRCIDQIAETLPTEKLNELVGRLNTANDGRLSAVWEACLLCAFGRIGTVEHEKILTNGKCADIFFLPKQKDHLSFYADIVTISDKGTNRKNPVQIFRDELYRLAKKYGISPNGLRWDIKARRQRNGDGKETSLLLPSYKTIHTHLQRVMPPFFKKIVRDGLSTDIIEINENGVLFSVSYDSTRKYAGGGHPKFTGLWSQKRNTLQTEIKSKADKLKGVPKGGIKGVIVCDGSYSPFSSDRQDREEYSIDSVVQEAMRLNSSLSFVLIITVRNKFFRSPFGVPPEQFEILPNLWCSPNLFTDVRLIENTIKSALSNLPPPVSSPVNASHRSLEEGYGQSDIGGYKMSCRSIKISSRALLGLLSGTIPFSEFQDAHNWGQGPFLRALSEGRMFTKITIQPTADEGDDWIHFDLGEPDPLISPFVSPRQK